MCYLQRPGNLLLHVYAPTLTGIPPDSGGTPALFIMKVGDRRPPGLWYPPPHERPDRAGGQPGPESQRDQRPLTLLSATPQFVGTSSISISF